MYMLSDTQRYNNQAMLIISPGIDSSVIHLWNIPGPSGPLWSLQHLNLTCGHQQSSLLLTHFPLRTLAESPSLASFLAVPSKYREVKALFPVTCIKKRSDRLV